MEIKQLRKNSYIATGIALLLLYLVTYPSDWQGSSELHTIMESIATVLALFVDSLALILFYSHGGNRFLIFGTGFIGVAFLDAYHALVTSNTLAHNFPSDLSSLMPWSWLASRLFLSAVILSSYIIIKTDLDKKLTGLFSAKSIYGLTALAAICSFAFFAYVPLPDSYFQNGFTHRPAELLPALLFLLAFTGYYKLGNWKEDDFEHWLLIAIMVNLITQLAFITNSSNSFDVHFDIAHLLKKLSYICVLTGLGISVFKAFKQVKSEARVRKKAQSLLEASEIRNRTLVTSLVDGLVTINDEGIIENINNAACRLFGYSKLELLGKNIKTLMPEPYYSKHDEYLKNYDETNITYMVGRTRKVKGLKKDKTLFPLDIAVSKMVIGGVTKFSGIIRDDTERQNSENKIIAAKNEAEISAKAKSDFLATMSHEIRTPMNGVIGMAELLHDTDLNSHQQEMLDTIIFSGHALIDLINDILDISKIEAGKIEIDHAPFDLERIIYDVIKLLSIKFNEKNIEIIFHYHSSCPRHVIGDSGRIRQILLNLIGNAIKFTDQGHIAVKVTGNEKADDVKLKFEIIDSGIGIDKKAKENIFESFTQADGSTSRKYGGTGLGLSICKKLIKLMNGKIDVISAPGNGSTFWFELDFRKTEPSEPSTDTDLTCNRALIIIKNKYARNMLIDKLFSWNITTDELSNINITTEQAITEISKNISDDKKYQIIIIENSGINIEKTLFSEKIKNTELTKNISLILYNPDTRNCSAQQTGGTGYSSCITAPILSEQLYHIIKNPACKKEINIHYSTNDSHTPETEIKGNVLLVEDVIVNQMVATGLLSKFDLNIDIANNGLEAINLFNKNHYDIILMDCQMPVMDGFEASRKIREKDKKIPIIAVTANALPAEKKKQTDAGINDCLIKPFNRQQLTNMLLKWLTKDISVESENPPESVDIEKNTTKNNTHVEYSKLDEMKSIMGNVFPKLIPAYIEQSDSITCEMLNELNKNNLTTLERHAHSMKSSSENIGAKTLSQLSESLEEMSRDNKNSPDLKIKISEITDEYTLVRASLLKYR